MKKTNSLAKICLAIFLSLLLNSCGKGGGDIIDSLIPDLSAKWNNTSTTEVDEYFFLVDNAGAPSSTFNGNENFNSEQHSFAGDYKNSKIQFTFSNGPKAGTKYTGTISGTGTNEIITLSTPSGTIVLKRQ